jgi:hypothetical protein
MERFPKYSFGTWVAAVLNMSHLSALVVALVALVAGLATIRGFPWTSGVVLAFSALILGTQVVSRVRFIRGLSAIRPFEGGVEIFHTENRRWYPGSSVTSLAKKDFAYADPWRPITVGFPGIEIGLKGISTPAEVLFPYGLEEHRDKVFEHLEKLFTGRVVADSKREDG